MCGLGLMETNRCDIQKGKICFVIQCEGYYCVWKKHCHKRSGFMLFKQWNFQKLFLSSVSYKQYIKLCVNLKHAFTFSVPPSVGCSNACTLVPTVFLRNGKTEFELALSFFVYPRHQKTEFEIPFSFSVFLIHWKWNSNLYFRFPFSYYIETGISTIFVFRLPITLENRTAVGISVF